MQWFDFSKGAKISKVQIDKWIKEIKDYLECTPNNDAHLTISSGNTIVFGTKSMDNEITIRVCENGYKEASYFIK